ncbi:MAG: methyltransferase domain-containing protein [Fimbriimonadaceae bacterium]|nr:methyltransferase domain-containing protein [Fimbriimonadaceae bacterium]
MSALQEQINAGTCESSFTHCVSLPLDRNVQRWRDIGAEFASTFPLDLTQYERLPIRGAQVLDYGAGWGRFIPSIMALSPNAIVAADVCAAACCRAESHGAIVEPRWIADPRALRLEVARYDVVLVVGVLSSIVPATERDRLLEQIVRSMRPGGYVVAADFGASSAPEYTSRYAEVAEEEHTVVTAEGLLVHHFAEGEMESLISKGLDVEDSWCSPVQTVHGRTLPGRVVRARLRRGARN